MDNARAEAPVGVRNRDIPILADVISVMCEITETEKRRDWQRDRMFSITQHITGMPGAKGGAKGLDDAMCLLSELDEAHETKCREYARTLKKAEKILNGIESHSMRAFVMMKYVLDRPDTEIREALNMGRRGFENARRCVEEAERMSEVRWRERYILISE